MRFHQAVLGRADASDGAQQEAMIADTMIPEAFDVAHDYAGLITVAGFSPQREEDHAARGMVIDTAVPSEQMVRG